MDVQVWAVKFSPVAYRLRVPNELLHDAITRDPYSAGSTSDLTPGR